MTVTAASSPVSSFVISWGHPKRLFIHFEHSGANSYAISGMELTPIVNTLVQRNRSPSFPGAARAGRRNRANSCHEASSNLAYVPSEVHVSHVIAVPGVDSTAVSNDGFSHSFIRVKSVSPSCKPTR